MVRASACHAEGRGFEPLHPRKTKSLPLWKIFCFLLVGREQSNQFRNEPDETGSRAPSSPHNKRSPLVGDFLLFRVGGRTVTADFVTNSARQGEEIRSIYRTSSQI